MTNKEILEQILLEDNITNIDLQDTGFMIDFGDVLNTETSTGNQYYLLGTYVWIPYSFNPNQCKLHRRIVNEYETNSSPYYEYSGFVHYGNNKFCYGHSGVDYTCYSIMDEGLNNDNFNLLLIKLQTYLSNSSHDSGGRRDQYKKLDLNDEVTVKKYIKDYVTINDMIIPKSILTRTTSTTNVEIDYDSEYIVLKEHSSKRFKFRDEEIVPKVVRHKFKNQDKISVVDEVQYLHPSKVIQLIIKRTENSLYHEINYKTPITTENLLHQLANKLNRVDGSFYI